jgi:hypothetical protein
MRTIQRNVARERDTPRKGKRADYQKEQDADVVLTSDMPPRPLAHRLDGTESARVVSSARERHFWVGTLPSDLDVRSAHTRS